MVLGNNIEVKLLKPPPGRKYIWCIQSPFDNKELHVKYFDGGSIGVRVTLVNGNEAHLFREYRLTTTTKGDLSDGTAEINLEKVKGTKIFLVTEDSRDEIIPRSEISKEVLEAFEVYRKKINIAYYESESPEDLVLEILVTEPVAGGDATR